MATRRRRPELTFQKHIADYLVREHKHAGLSRESLYKALSGARSPDFDTILKFIGALGLKLHAQADRPAIAR